MKQSPVEARITAMLAPSLEHMGFTLVQVKLQGGEYGNSLQIFIEHTDASAVNLDECGEVSHHISALLDVEDPIASAYTLEVSSPGMDRPLTKADDFERYNNEPARVEVIPTSDGRKRLRGTLRGLQYGNLVRLEMEEEGQSRLIPLNDITEAKLQRSKFLGGQPKPGGRRKKK